MSDRMISVCFLIDSLGKGGAERSTAALLPHLRAHGVKPTLVTLYTADKDETENVRAAGTAVRTLRARSYLGRILELRKMLRSDRPDVLITALYASDQIGRIAAFGTATRVVSSLVTVPRAHRPDPTPLPRWKAEVVDTIDRLTGRFLVDRFHAVTSGVARLSIDAGLVQPGRVTVVERGRDTAELGEWSAVRRVEVRKRLGVPNSAVLIVAVGRQDRAKDYPTMLRAVESLAGSTAEVLLLVAGKSGNASRMIEETIESSPSLRRSARLLGDRDDIGDLVTAADVFVLSSQYEGAAGAVLEAMALCAPIVATNVPGLEGVLSDGVNATLVPVGDAEAMTSAIAHALENQELTQSRVISAKQDFDERFRIDIVARRMADLFRSVAGDLYGRDVSRRS